MVELMMAVISEESPRYGDWMKVFGTNRVPVVSPLSHTNNAPGIVAREFYKLNVRALSPEQRARMVAHLAEKFGAPISEVERDIDGEHGVPILADDVMMILDARAFMGD